MIPTKVDQARLEKAKKLSVRPMPHLGPDIYEVTGGSKPRIVNLGLKAKVPCGCPDQIYRHETACKHTLAAALYKLQRQTSMKLEREAVGV